MPSLATTDAERLLPEMLNTLRGLVEIESPTTDKPAVDRAGRYVADRMAALGAGIQHFPQVAVGDHWLGTWGAGPGGILMLVHLDTVHSAGTLERFPWSQTSDRVYGPGVLDMKAGAAIALTTIGALNASHSIPTRRLSLLFTSDEETGSHSSVGLIQAQAQDHELVLCLEPALPDGSLKTWRKGVGDFELVVKGKAAHAGANQGEGVNAIHEMARQIPRIVEMEDQAAGTTLNVGIIRGGTRSNVIPAESRAQLDIRVQTPEEQARVTAALISLAPIDSGAEVRVEGEWNRPPMPRSETMVATFERARAIAAEIGVELSEGGTGGGSDANFVAPLGVPLLDGLGAVGGGAHTEQEYVLLRSLPVRTALLANLLTEW